jgi:hypothetical protein
MSDKPVITKGAFDSQNLAFWDPAIGKYRDYHRAFRVVRDIMTCTSDDFLTWTPPTFLEYPGVPLDHLYTNAVRPYERAPHFLLGFPTRFLPKTEQTEPTFMASRDGVVFKRWTEPVIPATAPKDRDGNRSNYMAWGMVQLPGRDNELTVYGKEAYYKGPGSRLRRFTYRVDGFVSIYAPPTGGEVVTKPIRFQGSKLVLNYTAAPTGYVAVEVQNDEGYPIKAFVLSQCRKLNGNSISETVVWNDSADLKQLTGTPVRLRFVLRRAELFSYRFQ